MKRKFLVCILAAAVVMSMSGCHKKESSVVNKIEYSDIIGVAEGTADFKTADSPEISIKDIQSYVGQDIDYSSGIDVKNVDEFEDFQMWVDATGVDIYTAGKYTAVYKFVFGGRTLEKAVGVTILEKEESGGNYVSAGDSVDAGGNSSHGSTGGNNISADKGNSSGENGNEGNISAENPNVGEDSPAGGFAGEGNAQAGDNSSGGNVSGGLAGEGNAQVGDNSSGGNVSGGSGGGNNSNANSPNGNTGGATHEIITSFQSGTKKPTTIGYTNIELLSGSYVKIKCTSARYIVSTRTDESQVVKNDKTYNVSKLIITLNTGEEQVLETVEKAVN